MVGVTSSSTRQIPPARRPPPRVVESELRNGGSCNSTCTCILGGPKADCGAPATREQYNNVSLRHTRLVLLVHLVHRGRTKKRHRYADFDGDSSQFECQERGNNFELYQYGGKKRLGYGGVSRDGDVDGHRLITGGTLIQRIESHTHSNVVLIHAFTPLRPLVLSYDTASLRYSKVGFVVYR